MPYLVFKDKGYDIKVTSINGREVPLDPNIIEEKPEWKKAEEELKDTAKLSNEDAVGFDAIFLPGSHGTMFDFPDNETLLYILRKCQVVPKTQFSSCIWGYLTFTSIVFLEMIFSLYGWLTGQENKKILFFTKSNICKKGDYNSWTISKKMKPIQD